MKIRNKQGQIIEVPKGMEDIVKKAIQSGKDPLKAMKNGGKLPKAELGDGDLAGGDVTSNPNYNQSYDSGLGSTYGGDPNDLQLPSNYGANSPSMNPQSPPSNYNYANPPVTDNVEGLPKPKNVSTKLLTNNPYLNRVQSGLSTIDKGIKQGGDEGNALIGLGALKTGLSGSAGIANEIGAWKTYNNVTAPKNNNFINLFKDNYNYDPMFNGDTNQYAKYGKSIMSAESGMNIPSKFRGDRHYENSQGGIPIDVNIQTNDANNMQVPINQANLLVEDKEYYLPDINPNKSPTIQSGGLPKMEFGGGNISGVLSDRKKIGVKINGKKLSPSEHFDYLSKKAVGFTPDQMTKAIAKVDKFGDKYSKYLTDNSAQNTKNAIDLLEQTYAPIFQQVGSQAFMQQEIEKNRQGLSSELSQAKLGKALKGRKITDETTYTPPKVEDEQVYSQDADLSNFTYMSPIPQSFELPSQNLADVNITTRQLVSPSPTNLKGRNPFVAPKYKTQQGIVTPTNVNLNAAPPTDYETRAKMLEGLRKVPFNDVQDFQGYDYDLALQSPEGQASINKMWLDNGLTNAFETEFPDIAKKIQGKQNLTYDEMVKVRKNYVDNKLGKRILNYDPSLLFNTKLSSAQPPTNTAESDKPTYPAYPPATAQDDPELDYRYPLAVNLQTYPRDPVQLLQQTPHDYIPKNLTPQIVRRPYRGVTSVDRSIAGQDFLNDTLANQQSTQQANNVNIAARNEADRFNLSNRQNVDTGNLNRKQTYMDAIGKGNAIIQQQMDLDENQVLAAQTNMNHEQATKDYLASIYDPRYAFNSAYTPIIKQKDNKKSDKKSSKYGGKVNIKKKK